MNTDNIQSLTRLVLGIVTGILAKHGVETGSIPEDVIAGIVALATFIWGIVHHAEKRNEIVVLKEEAVALKEEVVVAKDETAMLRKDAATPLMPMELYPKVQEPKP